MAVSSDAPTGRPLGQPVPGFSGAPQSWAGMVRQTSEDVPELRWPQAWKTYDRMIATDAELAGLYLGTVLPLEEYDYWLDANGCDDARTALLAEDLGVPVGDRQGFDREAREGMRPLGRFTWAEHLAEVVWAPVFGHYPFEIAGDVVDGLWRLRQLGPLHPSSLAKIQESKQGELEYVQQSGASLSMMGNTLFAGQNPKIPASRLVPYVWWSDATTRWVGRSLIRPLYRNWLCKDVLLRVDVTNHKRAGGVPYVETDERFQGANLDDLQRLAAEFEIDEEGGAALPPGATLKLAMVRGSDIVGSIRYHDEQMGKVWQAMVRTLGMTQTGSRALGETFMDMEALARRAIAGWICGTFTRWLVQRWWVWNFGEGERFAPVLRFAVPQIEGSDGGTTAPGDAQPVRAKGAYFSRGCLDA